MRRPTPIWWRFAQFLPGPASSQVGIALGAAPSRSARLSGGVAGIHRALYRGSYPVRVWGAFWGDVEGAGWLNGLKTAAVAVMALAVWGMAGSLCPDRPRAAIAIAAAIAMLAWPLGWGQMAVIVVAGVIGWRFLRTEQTAPKCEEQFRVNRRLAVLCLGMLGALLAGLPVLRQALDAGALLEVFDSFYRAGGSLVFSGGHLVLPLLQELVVAPGWVSNAEFVAGYGTAVYLLGLLGGDLLNPASISG